MLGVRRGVDDRLFSCALASGDPASRDLAVKKEGLGLADADVVALDQRVRSCDSEEEQRVSLGSDDAERVSRTPVVTTASTGGEGHRTLLCRSCTFAP